MSNDEQEFLEGLIEDQTQQLKDLESGIKELRQRCLMIRQAYKAFLNTYNDRHTSDSKYPWMTELDECVLQAMLDSGAIDSENCMTRREIAAAAGASETYGRLLKRLQENKMVVTVDAGSYLSALGRKVAESLL